MKRTENDPFQNLWDALDSTGVGWKLGQQKTGHHNILPSSSLKPWSPEEQSKLEMAVKSAIHPCANKFHAVTFKMTRSNWESYTPKKGRGFRVFTSARDIKN